MLGQNGLRIRLSRYADCAFAIGVVTHVKGNYGCGRFYPRLRRRIMQ